MEIASPKDTQCFLPSSPSILQKPNVGVRTPSSLKQYCYGWIVLGLAVILLCPTSSRAQSWDLDGSFFAKLGTGLSDYTGDFPAQNTGYPVDFQEFIRGSGLPIVVNGEVGYEFSRHGAVILGIQGGNYPIVGYGGGRGISDSYRYTPQLLGRYTFDRPFQDGLLRSLAPYVDGGLNVTFGGAQNVGVGPSLGAGVNIPVDRSLSFYVESRFNIILPDDAVDGADTKGPVDMTNQLLGVGLKMNLTPPTAPRVIALDGPAKVHIDTSVTFAARVNGEEAARPLTSQWAFGDGGTETGLTATHTYDEPGTYTVAFSARNEAGNAKKTIEVKATRPPRQPTVAEGARIASLNATPNPVAVGDTIQFRSAVEGGSTPAYEWRFGDGVTATNSSPTHAYNNPGRYTARLRASNKAGKDVQTVAVRVNPRTRREQAEQWAVVVASMRNDERAEILARQYRHRFAADESMPVDVVAAETDQGLRFRVVLGTFEDDDAARQALTEHEGNLPAGAWILRQR